MWNRIFGTSSNKDEISNHHHHEADQCANNDVKRDHAAIVIGRTGGDWDYFGACAACVARVTGACASEVIARSVTARAARNRIVDPKPRRSPRILVAQLRHRAVLQTPSVVAVARVVHAHAVGAAVVEAAIASCVHIVEATEADRASIARID